MTIYFDENKRAYNTRPDTCICEIEDYVWSYFSQYPEQWDIIDGVFTDLRDTEEYKEYQKQKQIDKFNSQFFNTSLGYIRRKVTMKDGTHKDFLSDLLPTISMAVNIGQEVKVIAYDMPDFDNLKPIEEYQHNETVTAQFIKECFMQLSADFGVVNETIET